MAKRTFHINLEGRVKKIKIKDFLVPLYEAISNSIHAIEANNIPGQIIVELLRSPRQASDASINNEISITGFTITDNGVGFNEAHMHSFCESDSPFKASIGGKGIGRFSWLKFFEKATVQSVFEENSQRKRRDFVFSTAGVEDEVIEVTSNVQTIVQLSPLQLSYESKTRKSLQEVCINLIEHFIAYLVTNTLPQLIIKDGAATRDIGKLYQQSIGQHTSKHHFVIKDQHFSATAIKFFLGNSNHTGFLCADKRVADRIFLGQKDAYFSKRFTDEELRQYAFQVFVESEYLNALVNDHREGFRFTKSSNDPFSVDFISKEEITEEVLKIAHQVMALEIGRAKATNIETVSTFVHQEAPQYRHIIAKHSEKIAAIHESEKIKIDLALRKIQFEEELKTRQDIHSLFKKTEEIGVLDKKTWEQESTLILEKLSEEGKASLASYIVQRKRILELFEKRLEISEETYAKEEAIHHLIFPMRTTSDEVNYQNQNLWIIDERLSYHYYLASDKPLNAIPALTSSSHKEPDIIVFNRPIALNDKTEGERLESIIIIEFKRPGETSVEGQKNPVQQIQEYIELIQAGRANNRKGRPITVTDATHFFGYVLCELDPLLKKVLKRLNMKETPDGRGMFGFFEEHKAYIEVISYEKMLDDAKKRNRILFEKLQLPLKQ